MMQDKGFIDKSKVTHVAAAITMGFAAYITAAISMGLSFDVAAKETNHSSVASVANTVNHQGVYDKLRETFTDLPDAIEVNESDMKGIYEIVLPGPEIIYTTQEAKYLFLGDIIALEDGNPVSMTGRKIQEFSKLDLSTFNTDNAIKKVLGNGERTIYTFEDPNCPFCTKLHKELDQLNDVTIYTFVIPILSPKSMEVAKKIWCSSDRDSAWDNYMSKGQLDNNDDSCDVSAIYANLGFAQANKINSTPTIYFDNGEVIKGYVSKERLEQTLNK